MKKTKLAVTSMDEQIAELLSTQDEKTLAIWAADCAEHVLHYFEEAHPEDLRPRQAIEVARAWVRGDNKMIQARKAAVAAHAAAREANTTSACATARATGHAAGTAHMKGHAVYAGIYATTASRDAADTIDSSAACFKEREWQYQHLLDLVDKL